MSFVGKQVEITLEPSRWRTTHVYSHLLTSNRAYPRTSTSFLYPFPIPILYSSTVSIGGRPPREPQQSSSASQDISHNSWFIGVFKKAANSPSPEAE